MLALCYVNNFNEKQDMLKRYKNNILEEQEYQIGFSYYKGMIYRYYMYPMINIPEALKNSKWNLNMINHAKKYVNSEIGNETIY